MKDYCIELPLFLPPFPVPDETETIDCPQATVRRKTHKGVLSSAKKNVQDAAPTIEAELGRLEKELAADENQHMFQVAQLQHHHEHCASQLSVRESLSRLETALCHVIRSHNHKLVMLNMVMSQHQQTASSSSVIQGEAFEALLNPTFNPHYLQAIDQVVHNMDNWIGSCLRKHVPFADEVASLEVGDLVWVFPAAISAASSSTSLQTMPSSYINTPYDPDLLRKQGWRKCVVIAIKGDLHFPRFIKVRSSLEYSCRLSWTEPMMWTLFQVRPVVTTTREAAVFGTFPAASKLLHRQLSVHLAQWIAVETGIVRVDVEANRMRREKAAVPSTSEILSETQSEATLTDHMQRMTHVDVIELTSSSSASPDTVIIDAVTNKPIPAVAISVTMEEASVGAEEAVQVSPITIESVIGLEEVKAPSIQSESLRKRRREEDEEDKEAPRTEPDETKRRRKVDEQSPSASPTTTSATAASTSSTASTSDLADDTNAVDPLPVEQPVSSDAAPIPAVQPAASRPPTANYHSALGLFSTVRVNMKPAFTTFRIGSKGKVVANEATE